MSTEAEKSRGGLFSSRVSQQHFAAKLGRDADASNL